MTLLHNDNQAFLVIDEAVVRGGLRPRPAPRRSSASSRSGSAETVEELESEMGLPAGTLQSTVEVYNRHAAERVRTRCSARSPSGCKPIGSPIAALDLRNFTAGFTLGGLRTT